MNAKRITILLFGLLAIGNSFCQVKSDQHTTTDNDFEITKTEEEWKAILSPEQFNVLREKGTEYAFTGKFYDFKEKGIYTCAACNNVLFDSKTKYNSGSGWPSFYQPLNKSSIKEIVDKSMGMTRAEIVCAKCGGHLGHVFEDGPKPTGLRYCVNSVSMEFKKKE